MQIDQVQLTNFRGFENTRINDLNPGINLIIGPNGMGKSNFLESISLISTGFSFRTKRNKDLIRWGENLARIEGVSGENTLSIVIQPSNKKYLVNGKFQDLRKFVNHLKIVFFQPSDLNLLTGSPNLRRLFINRLIAQLDFEYLFSLSSYQKLLHQRNQLMKSDSVSDSYLDVLEGELSKHAEIIFLSRGKIVRELNEILSPFNTEILYLPSPRGLRELVDNSAGIVAEIVREKMRELREKERKLGFSLIGPQRDEFAVFIADNLFPQKMKNAGIYGSRGQQRMAVIMLKLGEVALIEREVGERPLLVLDDVFSELDELNQSILLKEIPRQQTFVSGVYEDIKVFSQFPHLSRISLRE
jgi:DNA replication and repair protein RecF